MSTNLSQSKVSLFKNPTLLGLGLVSLLNDVASEMIYPVIPIFLKTVLGAPPAVIGLIEGIAESTASLLKLISGWLSDKLKHRKWFVVIGYSVSAVSRYLLSLAGIWPMVLLARFLDRFGKGVRTSARDALIIQSVPIESKGQAFGLHRSMDSLGAVFGPLLALILIHLLQDNFRLIFKIAVIPSVLGVLALIFLVKEKISIEHPKPGLAVSEKFKFNLKEIKTGWKSWPMPLKLFLFANLIFSLGNSSDAFLILRAQNLGLTVSWAVTVYVLYNFVYSGLSLPAGILADKIGAKKVWLWGLAIFSVVYAGFALAPSAWLMWLLFPIYGIYIAFTDGVSKSYLAELAPKDQLATVFGAQQMVVGLASFFASLAGGWLWQLVGPGATFWLGSFGAILALGIMWQVPKFSSVKFISK